MSNRYIYAMEGYIDMATGTTEGLQRVVALGNEAFCGLLCWAEGAVDCVEHRRPHKVKEETTS